MVSVWSQQWFALTYPLVADVLLVADRLVGLERGHGTGGGGAVAEAEVAAAVVLAALVARLELALLVAARALRGAARLGRPQGARLAVGIGVGRLRPAAGVGAVLLPAAVALLAGLDDAVAAQRLLRLGEAALGAARLGQEHLLDALEAAGAEAAVVGLVAGGGAREHDVVAVGAARHARLVVLRVVLLEETRFAFDAPFAVSIYATGSCTNLAANPGGRLSICWRLHYG